MRKVYENVSSSRLACMRREAQRQIKQLAAQGGFTIERLSMPEGDNATWRCVLAKGGTRLEFAVKVARANNRLTLEVLRMPSFIPGGAAISKVDAIYRHCG